LGEKTPLWRAIAGAVREDLAEGAYRPGAKLPTEAQLAERFGVNRHTVRHALSALAEEGLVRSRRGSGVYVVRPPTEYRIGQRVRFHENLLAAGRHPEKRVLSLEQRTPTVAEAQALQGSTRVLVYHGLSLADGEPIAVFQSIFPADRLPGLAEVLQQESGVTVALAEVGVRDYTRASTRLTAVAATATLALHLGLVEGAPVLRSTGINVDPEGRPVEFGRTWFAGDRVTLTLEEHGERPLGPDHAASG